MTIINENAVKTLKIIVNDSKTNKATKNEQQVNQITNPYSLNSYNTQSHRLANVLIASKHVIRGGIVKF